MIMNALAVLHLTLEIYKMENVFAQEIWLMLVINHIVKMVIDTFKNYKISDCPEGYFSNANECL